MSGYDDVWVEIEKLEDGWTTVSLTGDLVKATVDSWAGQIDVVVEETGGQLIIDFTHVHSFDTEGLQVLRMASWKAMEREIIPQLTGLTEEHRRILAAVGFLDMFLEAEGPP